jgi:hypothetical protein
VLKSHIDRDGRAWLRIRPPARPDGQTGWVPRNDLGRLQAVRTMLRVNRALPRATLYRDGRPIWSSLVGVGKAATRPPGTLDPQPVARAREGPV